MDPPREKLCPSCDPPRSKSLSEFTPDKRKPDGRTTLCRACLAKRKQDTRKTRSANAASPPDLRVVRNTDERNGSKPPGRARVSRRATEADSDDSWCSVFLTALAERPHVGEACRAASVDRDTVYRRRLKDALFASAWDAAREDSADVVRATAWDRGVDGWEEPVFGRVERIEGELVIGSMQEIGSKHQYDSSLLKVILQGLAPEYRPATRLTITDEALEAEREKLKGEVGHLRSIAGGQASPSS